MRWGSLGLRAGLIHWGLFLGTQLENIYALNESTGALARLPFFQLEGALVALALGALFELSAPLAWVLLCAANFYVALDPVAYRLFLTHFHWSLNENHTALAVFRDSILAELDTVAIVNLVAAAALSAYVGVVAWKRGRSAAPRLPRQGRWALAGLLSYGVLSVAVTGIPGEHRHHELETHPLVALFEHPEAQWESRLERAGLDRRIFESRYAPARDGRESRALEQARRELKGSSRPPNIVLIVLESVGSVELFAKPGALFSPEVTPFLHEATSHALVFDSLYGPYPATTAAHAALLTGGFVTTWSSLAEAVQCRYRGETLPGALRAAGYQTGLFSAAVLDAEHLDDLYKSVGDFEHVYDFGETDYRFQKAQAVTSWGGSEDGAGVELFSWLDHRGDPARPFFAELVTISTHHPYGTPRDYHGPFKGPDARSRFRNALHYTDYVLSKVAGNLAARGLLDDTLIVLTGDHGEAFGDRHAGNRLHRNALYEENVRDFLVVLNPRLKEGPVVSHEVVTSGDVLPTLAGLAGVPLVGKAILGRDLLRPDVAPRTAFFYKSTFPGLWGARDGRWKLIAPMSGSEPPSLYDLEQDPAETRSLASEHPEIARDLGSRARRWFSGMSGEYLRRLGPCASPRGAGNPAN